MNSTASVQDVPIFDLHTTGGKSIRRRNRVIVFPGEHITARAHLPKVLRRRTGIFPHIRSTFARLQADVVLDGLRWQQMLQQKKRGAPEYLPILFLNQGRYPLLIKEGDTIAVANHKRLMRDQLPISMAYEGPSANAYELTIHLGNAYLKVDRRKLPVDSRSRTAYIDPHADDLDVYTTLVEFQEKNVRPGQHFVLSTQQWIEIPQGTIGMFSDEPARRQGLQHSSALFAYPYAVPELTKNPRQFAVEFLVRRHMKIKPGMAVITLRLYRSDFSRNGDKARYSRQKTIVPRVAA